MIKGLLTLHHAAPLEFLLMTELKYRIIISIYETSKGTFSNPELWMMNDFYDALTRFNQLIMIMTFDSDINC